MSRRIVIRIAGGLLVLLVLGWFAYVHVDQRVTLDFGLFDLSDVPLSVALYGAVIVGMLIMMGIGVQGDLRTRELLRRYEAELGDAAEKPQEASPSEQQELEEADRTG